MTTPYDTAVVHSYLINPDHSPTPQMLERLDVALALFRHGYAATLTMTGGLATKGVQCAHSVAMKRYATTQGIDASRIHSETLSLDTIGEAIFTKMSVIMPNGMKRIIAVSSDYHIPRIREIYTFVYGDGFEFRFEKAPSNMAQDTTTAAGELRKIRFFQELFKGIAPAQDNAILRRLFEAHPAYRGRADLETELQTRTRRFDGKTLR